MSSYRAQALERHVAKWRERGFDWSLRSCAHFASDWVLTLEGFDPLASVGGWAGMGGAARLVGRYGSLREAVGKELARLPIVPAFAALGDLVLFEGEALGAVGICNGRDSFLLRDGIGVASVGTEAAVVAWRVLGEGK